MTVSSDSALRSIASWERQAVVYPAVCIHSLCAVAVVYPAVIQSDTHTYIEPFECVVLQNTRCLDDVCIYVYMHMGQGQAQTV